MYRVKIAETNLNFFRVTGGILFYLIIGISSYLSCRIFSCAMLWSKTIRL